MEKVSPKALSPRNILLWVARIAGTLSLAFLAFMVGAHVIEAIVADPKPDGFQSGTEVLLFICFPISTIVGAALAWKWEGLGGFVMVLGLIGFHLVSYFGFERTGFNILIDGLMSPGFVYLIYWMLFKRKKTIMHSGDDGVI